MPAGRDISTLPSTVWAMTMASVALWIPISNADAIDWGRLIRSIRGTK